MDREDFVQKVKMLCLLKGVKPTNACKECGVGGSFLSDIIRGQVPSVERVQALAKYLNVTTSELLGETGPKNLSIQDQPYLVMRYNSLRPEEQEKVMAFIEFLVAEGKNKKPCDDKG